MKRLFAIAMLLALAACGFGPAGDGTVTGGAYTNNGSSGFGIGNTPTNPGYAGD